MSQSTYLLDVFLVCKFSTFGTKNFGCRCVDSKYARPSRLHSVSKATKLNAKTTKTYGGWRRGVSMFAWSEAFVDGAGGPEFKNQNPESRNSKFQIRIQSPEYSEFHKRRTRKTNAMATKCCSVCLAIRTRPHTHKHTPSALWDKNPARTIIKSRAGVDGGGAHGSQILTAVLCPYNIYIDIDCATSARFT